tara:strand:+ start:31 stop:339 length:309 start_codon:yes stop_codon:yes gene_type:complete
MKFNQDQKNFFNFTNHECIKDLSSLLNTKSEEDVLSIKNNKETKDLFEKIINKSNRVGSLYFKKNNKGYEFDLLFLQGITLVKDLSKRNEFIFIRSSDLDLL